MTVSKDLYDRCQITVDSALYIDMFFDYGCGFYFVLNKCSFPFSIN